MPLSKRSWTIAINLERMSATAASEMWLIESDLGDVPRVHHLQLTCATTRVAIEALCGKVVIIGECPHLFVALLPGLGQQRIDQHTPIASSLGLFSDIY